MCVLACHGLDVETFTSMSVCCVHPFCYWSGRLVHRSTLSCRLIILDCTSLHGTASRFIAFGSVRSSAMCKRRRTPSFAPCIIRVCEASNERRGRRVSVLTEHRRNCSNVVSTTCRLPTPASARANNQCFELRVQLLLRVRYRSMKCTTENYKLCTFVVERLMVPIFVRQIATQQCIRHCRRT